MEGACWNPKENYLFFTVYFSLHKFISLPSQNKFSFIRQMAQFWTQISNLYENLHATTVWELRNIYT